MSRPVANEGIIPGGTAPRAPAAQSLPPWLFAAGAVVAQAAAAVQQLQDPLRTVCFVGVLVATLLLALRRYRQLPTWFAAAMLAALAAFFVSPAAGKVLSLRLPVVDHAKTTEADRTDAVVQIPPTPTARFIKISAFIDTDGDGQQSSGESSLPGAFQVREYGQGQGYQVLNTGTGTTGPVQIYTRGSIVVTVCGVSEVHQVDGGHTRSDDPLIISVGVSSAVGALCKPQ
jgi:hypothetical protein